MLPTRVLLKHFSFHPSRIRTFQGLISGMLTGSSVQVPSLSKALKGTASLDSKQKRIYRFLNEQEICDEAAARLISSLLPQGPWVLAMDRTNWKFGDHDHNILTLAVIQDGIAVPILFTPLQSCGNSSTEERIEIISRFIKIFGVGSIATLLADREFIGAEWFEWLDSKGISFVIRIKGNQKLKHHNGGTMDAAKMCEPDQTYDTAIASQKIKVSCKALAEEKLIVAHSADIVDAMNLYAKRWDIETMFKALKSNGFRLESSHIKCPIKFKKILIIAAISFAIAVKAGKIKHEQKPIPWRKTLKKN